MVLFCAISPQLWERTTVIKDTHTHSETKWALKVLKWTSSGLFMDLSDSSRSALEPPLLLILCISSAFLLLQCFLKTRRWQRVHTSSVRHLPAKRRQQQKSSAHRLRLKREYIPKVLRTWNIMNETSCSSKWAACDKGWKHDCCTCSLEVA